VLRGDCALCSFIHGVTMFDVEEFVRYESGEMDWFEAVDFFQGLIDTGMAWRLQGSYGRTAMNLIYDGVCTA
jgi:hypothetical protein